jgi:hypothetical protein
VLLPPVFCPEGLLPLALPEMLPDPVAEPEIEPLWLSGVDEFEFAPVELSWLCGFDVGESVLCPETLLLELDELTSVDVLLLGDVDDVEPAGAPAPGVLTEVLL